MERVKNLVSQKPVVIFSKSSCCMCHTIKSFFCDLGVNAAIYELDEDPRGRETERVLLRLGKSPPAVPAVFIGGKLEGGANEVMSLHLQGVLMPRLREVGAIWV